MRLSIAAVADPVLVSAVAAAGLVQTVCGVPHASTVDAGDEWLDGFAFGSGSYSGSGSEPEPEPEPNLHGYVRWGLIAALWFAVLLVCVWFGRRCCCDVQQREAALQTEYDNPQSDVYLSGSLNQQRRHGSRSAVADTSAQSNKYVRDVPSDGNRIGASKSESEKPALRRSLIAPLRKPRQKLALDDVNDVSW